MEKSHHLLLMLVNKTPVAIFYIANMSLNVIHENKILAKMSELVNNKNVVFSVKQFSVDTILYRENLGM